MVRIAIIANPKNATSSGKFLTNFVNLMTNFASKIYVISDGRVRFDLENVVSLNSTSVISRAQNDVKSPFYLKFSLLLLYQTAFCIGLLRSFKKVNLVFVFPVVESLPAILTKMINRKLILYEGQDIFSEYCDRSLASRIRFYFLLFLRNITLKLADYIVVEGRSVVKRYGLENYSKKLVQGNMFVDTEKYRITKQYTDRKKIVGFIASLTDRKGILPFIGAVREMNKLNGELRFLIVGTGSRYEDVKSFLSDLIEMNVVQLTESVEEENFPTILNELSLYVLPSISEGLPNTILEAMACGTPVLATPVGAIPDVIKDEENGFLLDSIDSKFICRRITHLLNNTALLKKVGKNARSYVSEHFNYKRTLENWQKIYGDISFES